MCTAEKVVIKVNKFVHPVYQLPQIINPDVLAKWRSDYTDNGAYSRIVSHLQRFDKKFLGLFVGDRSEVLSPQSAKRGNELPE